jgi:hypothetical protein
LQRQWKKIQNSAWNLAAKRRAGTRRKFWRRLGGRRGRRGDGPKKPRNWYALCR